MWLLYCNQKIYEKNKELARRFKKIKKLSKNDERILISNINLDSYSSKFENLNYNFTDTNDNRNNVNSCYDGKSLSSNKTV